MYDSSFGLENHGLANLNRVYWNLPAASLVEMALDRGEGVLADNGALTVKTGDRTGRSPKDKFIVEDPASKNDISWGKVNKPIAREKFELLRSEVLAYLQNRDVFVTDAFAGADPELQIPIRFINEQAWQNLFVHQLFRRAKPEELRSSRPEFTVITVPSFKADPKRHGTNSEVFVIVDMENKLILIGGTHYAGEMKKSIFSVLNYIYPKRGVLSMHCAANLGEDGDTAIFFGLSGTGKTTLSADPARRLIGDDQHGWSKNGVFNFEGGCYAKTIRLSRKYEPQIWNALRFGSVLENVIVDPETRVPNYDDDSITENTRGAYPVEFIDNAVMEGMGGHPNTVMFLAADA
ncbi:MAG TPA: phosphoenolpyruvate carboxykinase (ATP), partial [Armatimonadota bacterium]|nr:phosphoenolpyruvate carboxykinase (ATP) [Armatimonadota bacterium]